MNRFFLIIPLWSDYKMIYSIIKSNSTGLIYGLAKTGKTIFCENMGMSIAAGRNTFLDDLPDIDNPLVPFLFLEENCKGRTGRKQKTAKWIFIRRTSTNKKKLYSCW